MELVLFMGIQGSGKSRFYQERFTATHVRVNLDTLKTRHRERLLVNACLHRKARFVVDNTNLTREDRVRYIAPAKDAGFAVAGYFFYCSAADAIARNSKRDGKARVPVPAIYSAAKRLQPPSLDEGYDSLFTVTLDEHGVFRVKPFTRASVNDERI